MSRIFPAAPYTQWMDWTGGAVAPERNEFLHRIRQAFPDPGHAVFGAHHDEGRGESRPAPGIRPQAGFPAMRQAGVPCVVPEAAAAAPARPPAAAPVAAAVAGHPGTSLPHGHEAGEPTATRVA